MNIEETTNSKMANPDYVYKMLQAAESESKKYEIIEKENKALLEENSFLQQSERTSKELNLLYMEEISNYRKEIKVLKDKIHSMQNFKKSFFQKLKELFN
jgi:hypothetical protein